MIAENLISRSRGGASSELQDEIAGQQDAQQDARDAKAEGDLHPGVQSYTERTTPSSGSDADTGTLSEEYAEKEGKLFILILNAQNVLLKPGNRLDDF